MDKLEKITNLFLMKDFKSFIQEYKFLSPTETERFNYSIYFTFRNLYLLKSTIPYKGMLKDLGVSYFTFSKMKDYLYNWTYQEALSVLESFNKHYLKCKEGKLDQELLIPAFMSNLLL